MIDTRVFTSMRQPDVSIETDDGSTRDFSLVGEWTLGSHESGTPHARTASLGSAAECECPSIHRSPYSGCREASLSGSGPHLESSDRSTGRRFLPVYFQTDVPVNATPAHSNDIKQIPDESVRPSPVDARALVGLEAVLPQEQQRDRWSRTGTRHYTTSVIETMWEADQPMDQGIDLQMEDSLEDGADFDSTEPVDAREIPDTAKPHDQWPRATTEENLLKSKSIKGEKSSNQLRIVTPRVKEEEPTQGRATSFTQTQTPAMKYPQTPSAPLTKPGNKAWMDAIETPVRTVSRDYPVPRWMLNTKVLAPNYQCPYKYTRTFRGKHGVVNYDVDGNPEDSLVLCFHGLNASRLTYQEIQDVFAKYNYCVVTYDLYGHGLSASPKYRDRCTVPCGCRVPENTIYGLDFYVEQAQELLEHLSLGNRPVSLIGFSMGGVVAAGFAQAYPDRVERLVLISTAGALAPKPPPPVRLLKRCTCYIPCVPLYICRCCCNRKRFMKKFSKEELESGMAEALWQRLMWQLFVKKGVIEAFLGSVANIPLWGAQDLFQQVGKNGLPTLILWGRADAVAPVSGAKAVLDSFENGHLIIFDYCSHLLLADQPQAVVALLLTFLEFPRTCNMREWRYLLPFTPRGVYVPRENRCPEGLTAKEFLVALQFKPRLMVRLPKSTSRPQSPSGDTTRDTERRSNTE